MTKPTETIEAPELSPRDIYAREEAIKNRKYYEGWPTIRGTICEYTGLHFTESPFYKELYKKLGKFVALDGSIIGDPSLQHVAFLYVPHRDVFISDTAKSEELYYKRYSGFEPLVSYHIFRRVMPYYGSLLQEPVTPRKDLKEILKLI